MDAKRRPTKRAAVIFLLSAVGLAVLLRLAYALHAAQRKFVPIAQTPTRFRQEAAVRFSKVTEASFRKLRHWSSTPKLSQKGRVKRSAEPTKKIPAAESAAAASPEPTQASHPSPSTSSKRHSLSCPAFTSPNPVLEEGAEDVYASGPMPTVGHTAPYHNRTWQALTAYGLRPMHPKLPTSVPDRAWRGSSVQVLSQRTSEPLRADLVRRPRPKAEVQQRIQTHRRCVMMKGPRGTASEVASEGRLHAYHLSVEQVVHDRESVLAHGLLVHQEMSLWADRARTAPGLENGFTTTEQPWHQGPWIEDYWLATFARPVVHTMTWSLYQALLAARVLPATMPALYRNSTRHIVAREEVQPYTGKDGEQLIDVQLPYDPELFHPWTPLLVPWEAIMTSITRAAAAPFSGRGLSLPLLCSLSQTLQQVLRGDHQYITLAQRSMGPWILEHSEHDAACSIPLHMSLINVLVVSSGGIGHVPIPLLGRELPLLGCSANTAEPESKLVFIGSRREGLRAKILDTVQGLDPFALFSLLHTKETLTDPMGNASPYMYLDKMAKGTYQLAPRGTGPTSFRLYESLQLGLVPVYVHSGQPWLPYLRPGESWQWQDQMSATNQSLWAQIAFVVHGDHFEGWMRRLLSHDPGDALWQRTLERHHRERKRVIAQVRDKYFTYDGVMRRLAEWLDDPDTAELACQGSSFL